jgi:hypothetical protein
MLLSREEIGGRGEGHRRGQWQSSGPLDSNDRSTGKKTGQERETIMKERLKGFFRRSNAHDLLSILLVAVFLGLILLNLSMYPVNLDIPYHMAVTKGFQEAGGVTTWDYWDYAPVGRPHIYPPLLHVIMSLMLDVGLPMEETATFICLAMFPLILLSLWWAMRRLFSPRAAFYALALAGVCYVFFWQTGVTVAASLVLALTPLVFLSLEEDHKVAAAVLLAMCLYSHLVLGHLVALALLIYMLHRRAAWKKILTTLVLAYLLYLPWGINVLANLGSFNASEPGMGGGFSLHVLLWALAVAGLVICYLHGRRYNGYYLLPAYLFSMVPIVFFYSNRFWDGHVFLPLAMLGGVALDRLHSFMAEHLSWQAFKPVHARLAAAGMMSALLLLVLCVDPVVASPKKAGAPWGQYVDGDMAGPGARMGTGGAANTISQRFKAMRDGSIDLVIQPTTLMVLVGLEDAPRNAGDQQPVFGEDNRELMRAIEEYSDPGDIVYVPEGRLGDLIYAMTGRYVTAGMFHEVQPEEKPDPSSDAALAVLPSGPFSAGGLISNGNAEGIFEQNGWNANAQAGRYVILVNEGEVDASGKSGQAALPLWAAYALLLAAVLAMLADIWRGKRPDDPVSDLPLSHRLDKPPGYEAKKGKDPVLVVIPACNEENNIALVVMDVKRLYPWMDVLVVDDGSRDRTNEVALKAGAMVLRFEENRGVGEAERLGLQYAYRDGYLHVVRLDGDGQHPADCIHRLLAPLKEGKADVVVGSRFFREERGGYGTTVSRRLGIAYFKALLRLTLSRSFSDPTSGFRAYSRQAMLLASQTKLPRYPEVSSLHLLVSNHLRVMEVPVSMAPRRSGSSSLRGWQGLAMVAGVTLNLLKQSSASSLVIRDISG